VQCNVYYELLQYSDVVSPAALGEVYGYFCKFVMNYSQPHRIGISPLSVFRWNLLLQTSLN
jgi:hypothetical protein